MTTTRHAAARATRSTSGARATRRHLAWTLASATSFAAIGCGSAPLPLHAPSCSTVPAHTEIEIEPMTLGPAFASVSPRKLDPPSPDGVMTAALRAELAGRVLEGGEPGGYAARCRLDRFAIRFGTEITTGMATIYVDADCTVSRKADHAVVWRGELRGRAATAAKKTDYPGEDEMVQSFADRLVSDAGREMAADLAVRVLGLRGKAAQRSFANEDAQRASAGLDDGPLGPLALTPTEDAARAAQKDLTSPEPYTRAAAWNALAMAAAPDATWLGGIDVRLDDDAVVRFYQYKALGRHATRATLSDAKRALKRENSELLQEMLRDTLESSGLAVRAKDSAATAATSGNTTTP